MKRLLMGLFCVLLSGVALAAGPDDVRKRMQASMLVTGSIIVAPDGTVRSYAIDHREKLPPQVVGLIDKGAKAWKFEPTLLDGQPVAAKADMSLRIVAKPVDKDDYSIDVEGAEFGQYDEKAVDSITYKTHAAPRYPESAARARVWGTVYLLLHVGRQGQVEDAVAEQVNMGVVASDLELDRWRRVLAKAALVAAKSWTFNIPTSGREASQDHWDARVPVVFSLDRLTPRDQYGKWSAYVPGLKQPVPWLRKSESVPGSVDALADGGLHQVGHGLHLKTPLNGP
ncbi:MAG TPA: energy transducer TonB [Rhodanobacter sp.]